MGIMIGTTIRKFFPRTQENPTPGWFNGKVTDYKTDECGGFWYGILYEDEDTEYMVELQLHQTFIGRRVEKVFGNQCFSGEITAFRPPCGGGMIHDLWQVTYSNGDEEDYTWDEIQEMVVVGGEGEKLPEPKFVATVAEPVPNVAAELIVAQKSAPVASEDEVEEEEEEEEDEENEFMLESQFTPAALESLPGEELMSGTHLMPMMMPSDSEDPSVSNEADDSKPASLFQQKLKQYSPVSVTPDQIDRSIIKIRPNDDHEQNMARAEAVLTASFHNMEVGFQGMLPKNEGTTRKRKLGACNSEKGRCVFRRSTGPLGPERQAGIGTLLGGDTRLAWPVVKKAVSPEFVKTNEFYVIDKSDWNPWGPRFAGEDGLLCVEAFERTQHRGGAKNKTFHLFQQCAKSPLHPRYQGSSASGSFFYAGKYRRIVVGDIVEEIVPYNQPDMDATRWALADLARQSSSSMSVRKKNNPWTREFTDADGKSHILSEVSSHHRQTARANNEEQWSSWNTSKRETAAWVELLREKAYVFRTVAIECVGYDEALYQRLVEVGAEKGRLSIEEIPTAFDET